MGTTLVKSKDQKIPLKGLLQAHGVPGDWGFQVSRQSEREGGKLNQPFTPVTFTSQKIFLVLISVRGWVDPRTIVRPEGLCKWKIPMIPSGIGLATFRLVAQCLKTLVTNIIKINWEAWSKIGNYFLGTRCTGSDHTDVKYIAFVEGLSAMSCHVKGFHSKESRCGLNKQNSDKGNFQFFVLSSWMVSVTFTVKPVFLFAAILKIQYNFSEISNIKH